MPSLTPLNMTTGPVAVSPAVLAAQHATESSPHVGDFWTMHDETIARLGRVLGTEEQVLAFSGTIRAALSIAIDNFVDERSRVLALSNGYWADLIADYCRGRGATVIVAKRADCGPLDPQEVEELLRANQPLDLVTMAHVETNIGVVNPIDQIGPLVAKSDALFLVDTACSAGGMPIDTDRIGIDIGVTGSHKTLTGLPGLSVITLSDKARRRLAMRTVPGYFNLDLMRRQTIERLEFPSYTQPPGLFAALNAALGELEAIGLPTWYARIKAAGCDFRAKVREMGLPLIGDSATDPNSPAEAIANADTVIALDVRGVGEGAFRGRLAQSHGIYVVGNLAEWVGKSSRIGLMSPVQLTSESRERTLHAVKESIDYLRSSAG